MPGKTLAVSLDFNFSSPGEVNPCDKALKCVGDTYFANSANPVPLWDAATGELARFSSVFSFLITPDRDYKNPDGSFNTGGGMAFFLARYSDDDGGVLNNTGGGGGNLGLFNDSSHFNATGDDRVVAVEFDTLPNTWDTSPQHVGIDVNSISSVASTYTGMDYGNKNLTANLRMTATVRYDNKTKLLAVDLEIDGTAYYVNSTVDLKSVLPGTRYWFLFLLFLSVQWWVSSYGYGHGEGAEEMQTQPPTVSQTSNVPEGSLDKHIYDHPERQRLLTWAERYKIIVGLESALRYLHREWEQCVVHGDIKPSNIMLNSSYNTKLGDFGLARLGDHGTGPQTTLDFSKTGDPCGGDLVCSGDVAFRNTTMIELTKPSSYSRGVVWYATAVPLWNAVTGEVASFTTTFSFEIMQIRDSSCGGDGMAFFLACYTRDSVLRGTYGAGLLSLFPLRNSGSAIDVTPVTGDSRVVAVEFDTVQNEWDGSSQHVGIDVNSIKSRCVYGAVNPQQVPTAVS
ncbi:L-type lectin-domain containing receptor kinase IX.1-like [Miscanthus floridulus]|uniref:L-type lectin-domain containing receptor kinase IX.1-like n=1 Tax=Miscanthus floridulus TaxID=154761 RepID=UPI003458B1D0